MGMAVVNFHHAYSCCGDTLQQLSIPVCMCKYWSVHVVAKYKNRYENNTPYPFYTVAVKHETGELMTLTHTLEETRVQNDFISSMIKIKYSMIIHQYTYTRVTLINTTWWQGKEYHDMHTGMHNCCSVSPQHEYA